MPGPEYRPARLRLTRRLCLAGGLATACARPDASPASTAATETTATDSSGAETSATGSGPLTTTAEASSGVTTATTTEGDTATTEEPATVGRVIEVRAYVNSTCVLNDAGEVWCFGLLDKVTDYPGEGEPPRRVSHRGEVRSLARGSAPCAVLRDGGVDCWSSWRPGKDMGYPGVLEVPDATRRIDAIPPMMVGGPAERVAVGSHAICAVLKGGSVRCWGAFFSADWDLGYSTGVYGSSSGYEWYEDSIPAQLEPLKLGGPASNVAVGEDRACALVEGSVECWGGESGGALGHGLDDPDATDFPAQRPGEAPPIDLGGRVVALDAAKYGVCGLRDDGAVFCWGGGSLGKPGAGVIGDDETPAEAGPVEIGAPAVDIVMGTGHVCALLENGAVRCFGSGYSGQLGYGNTENIGDDETPASVGDVPLGGKAVQLGAGEQHTCALLDTGGVRCWGRNSDRQLGYGHTDNIGDDETPASVGDVPLP